MKAVCPNCHKSYDIPEARLPEGKEEISFQCPACKDGIITIRTGSRTDAGASSGAGEKAREIDHDEGPRSTPSDEKAPAGDDLKRKLLRHSGELPALPQVVFKAQEVMRNPDSSLRDIAGVLETDQAIAARILKMANSVYYGQSGKVASIEHAAVLLGHKTLGELVTLAGSSDLLTKPLDGYGLEGKDLWRHSLAVALGSRRIANLKKPELADDAFISGIIHDVGKLVLDKPIQERQTAFDLFLQNEQKTFHEAEKEILGLDHSEIAYELCNQWHIPKQLANAVRHHHHPRRSLGNELVCIVHVADAIAIENGIGDVENRLVYRTDERAVEILGLEEEDIERLSEEIVMSVEQISEGM